MNIYMGKYTINPRENGEVWLRVFFFVFFFGGGLGWVGIRARARLCSARRMATLR